MISGPRATLADAVHALEEPENLVRLASDALHEAVPRGLAYAYILRGRPAEAVASIAARMEGEVVNCAFFYSVYAKIPRQFDPDSVDPVDRDRVVHVREHDHAWYEGYRRSPMAELIVPRRLLHCARYLACLAGRPLANLGLFAPEGPQPFTEAELAAFVSAAEVIGPALRLGGLLAGAAAEVPALDHLMASRMDSSFLLTSSGAMLHASPRGRRLVDRSPGVLPIIRALVRRGGSVPLVERIPALALEVHAAPCAPRGSSTAWLVTVAAYAPAGRGRVTPRQAELLDLVAEGLSNAQIADRMTVKPSAVKTMLERLYARYGVRGRGELVSRTTK